MRGRAVTLALLLLAASLAAGCGGEAPSAAANPYIAQAADEEERAALVTARDDIDAEMRARVAEKDAEIERLQKERRELEKKLTARGIEH